MCVRFGQWRAVLLFSMLIGSLNSPAAAQELGELLLESSRNEPLRASIELLDTQGLDAGQLELTVATAADYELLGLERPALVEDIDIAVERLAAGSGEATLTSTQPIPHTFLNLLVNARWPGGRSQRFYTVLMDLPVLAPRPVPLVATTEPPVFPQTNPFSEDAATTSGDGVTASTALRPDPDPSRRRIPSAAVSPGALSPLVPDPAARVSPVSDSPGTYTVQVGDSLGQVAERTRPARDIGLQQMMLALGRANPDAFVDNNINRLITGSVLRIPSREEITQVSQADAVAVLAGENPRIVVPTVANGNGASAGTEASLRVELERVRLENRELSARLAEFRQQFLLMEQLLAVQRELVAQLQNSTGNGTTGSTLPAGRRDPAAPAGAISVTQGRSTNLSGDELANTAMAGGSIDAASTGLASTAIAGRSADTSATATIEQPGVLARLQRTLERNLVVISSGVLLLLTVMAAAVIYRERHGKLEQPNDETPFDYLDDDDLDYSLDDAAPHHDFEEAERRFMREVSLPADPYTAQTTAPFATSLATGTRSVFASSVTTFWRRASTPNDANPAVLTATEALKELTRKVSTPEASSK